MKRVWLILLAVLICGQSAVSAHDVPERVRIAVFLKPENDRMVVLVRMPANALIDFLFPTLPDGNWLNLSTVDSVAAEGAKVWIADLLSMYEGGAALHRPQVLAVRISRVNDPNFKTFDDALNRVKGVRLRAESLVTQDQVTVDALLETPITSAHSNFSFEPRFARLGVVVDTTLGFLPARGGVRQFQYQGDPETFELDPGMGHTVTRFMKAGLVHYVTGTDYLLFAVCVALAFRRLGGFPSFVLALGAAESLVLLASLVSMTSAPWVRPLCAVLVAAVTAYVGIEAVIPGSGKRVSLATVAGLIMGCSFWFGLQPALQFGGTHPLVAGLGFNGGVVAAELLGLGLSVAAVQALVRLSRAPRAAVTIAAAVAIHVSWRRMLDRADAFAIVPLDLPAANPATVAVIGAGLVAALAASTYYYLGRRNPIRVIDSPG